MRPIYLAISMLIITTTCNAQNSFIKVNKKENTIGIPRRTANTNTPFIYENGYLNYTLVKVPLVENKETINLNELRFNAVFSAMYTKKVMYDRFGKWTKLLQPNKERHPILVWEKVKLFDNDADLYTVYADGTESSTEMYASVLVFDANNKDCLNDDHPMQSKLITYFSDGIENLNDSKNFYKVYWKTVKKLESKKR